MSTRALRALPAAAVGACCLWLAAADGGFYPRTWTAVAVVVAALVLSLVVAAWALRAALPRAALYSLGALTGFAVWSFATAFWADAPGDAVRGALVTTIYLAVFAIPLLWPPPVALVERLLLALALGLAVLGAVGVAKAISGSVPLLYGRLSWPTGYPNTTAAVLALGAWLALVVAARGSGSALLRGAAFAAAVWLGGLVVLARSQGAVVTALLAAALFVALAQRRGHAFALLLLGLLVLAPATPWLARVVNQYPEDQPAALRHAVVLLGVLTVAAIPLFIALEPVLARVRRRRPSATARVAILAAVVAAVLVAGATVSSSARVSAAWHDLTGGPGATTAASTYYGASLAGNRGDFWRVGLGAFAAHPLGGVGVWNYQAVYLRERHSDEAPRSPHSLAVTVLSETGAVGAALLAVSFVAIAVALVPAARREGATGTVAQAAVVGLTGWLAHAQLDWLWEMPAAAALALAVAGLGVGATSSGQVAPAPPSFGLPLVRGTAALAAAVVAVMAASLWLAVRYEERGVTLWRSAPSIADADLRRATRLDPLGSDALLIRGSIAARRGRWVEMRDAFTAAVARDGSDWYAALELAVAEAHLGNRPTALASARQAVRLNPRAAAARAALTDLRLGRIPSQPALDRALAAAST